MTLSIVGGGPAGLRAAEVAALAGIKVHLWDSKPSVGRKFLVAGKGGLNLTKAESLDAFVRRYSHTARSSNFWNSLIADFDQETIRAWAQGLGIETFVASTGRVYPKELRAAPLLRRWVERLRSLGVEFSMRHKLVELNQTADGVGLTFIHNDTVVSAKSRAVILALGGGSWPETGSDGKWPAFLEKLGVQISPLIPANCGWECLWPNNILSEIEGKPLKAITAFAGQESAKGELLVTRYGLEGGALYQLAPALRAMSSPAITIDFKPHSSISQLVAKMGPIRRNFLHEAKHRWNISSEVFVLLSSFLAPNAETSAENLAHSLKNLVIPLIKPRPIEEAISSAGGVHFNQLNEQLMVEKLPGLFIAGEMLDWEAPTGGYLLQGCFATGTRAGKGAIEWLKASTVCP